MTRHARPIVDAAAALAVPAHALLPELAANADGDPPEEDEELESDELGDEEAAAVVALPSPGEGRPAIIEQQFVVEGECHGWRLDRFLQKRMKRLSRSRVQRVILGDCDVDGRLGRPGMRVFGGQQVAFRRPAPPEPEVPRNIEVVYSDPSFYVIEKPAGLPIHPTARYHYSTLTAVLRERFPDEKLSVAHRLDRETSGLMLIARDAPAGSALKKAFARRLVHKRYLAIATGIIEADEFVVEAPLGPDTGKVRVRMAVQPLERGGLPARTAFRVLSRGPNFTLVECRPHTGRQHQIRVHLLSIGHPIVGDKLYPDEELFIRWADGGDAAVQSELALPRHALHAAGLCFPHPRSGVAVEVTSPLPADLLAFLEAHRV